MSARNLSSVADYARTGPFTEPQLRWWIVKEAENGLQALGAIVRVGRRVYLDTDAFSQWIDSQNPAPRDPRLSNENAATVRKLVDGMTKEYAAKRGAGNSLGGPTSTHTPGPWQPCFHLRCPANDDSCKCGFPGDIWGPDGEHVICTMGPIVIEGQECMSPPRYERATELANAQLIAASPGLLAACRTAVLALAHASERDAMYSSAYDEVSEAIYRATSVRNAPITGDSA